MSAFLLLTTRVYPLSLTYANMSLVGAHSDFGAMMLSDESALAKVAAETMAKGCAAAIVTVSFVPSYPVSVDSPSWSMAGGFVVVALLRNLRAIAIATAYTICKTRFHLY